MSSKVESYWSRSWALLTRDAGWYKPLLVLAAARMVPIVGAFGADGYALEWARLTSWGIDSSPKQKGVNIGECIKSGARAFVVALGYLFVFGMLRMFLSMVLGGAIGTILSLVIGVFAGVLILVAKLRATIYQTIGAGYQLDRIYDMIKHDTEGLLRIAILSLIMSLILGTLAGLLVTMAFIPSLGDVVRTVMEYDRYGYVDDYYVASVILSAVGRAMPALCIIWYVVGIAKSGMSLILTTAAGLWMRQFDVRNWGESSDLLPMDCPGLNVPLPESFGSYHDDPLVNPSPQAYEPEAATPFVGGAAASEPIDDLPKMVEELDRPGEMLDDSESWGLVSDEADMREAIDSLDRLDIVEPEQEPELAEAPEVAAATSFTLDIPEPEAEVAAPVVADDVDEAAIPEPEVTEADVQPEAAEPEVTDMPEQLEPTEPTIETPVQAEAAEPLAIDVPGHVEVPEPAPKADERIVEVIDLSGTSSSEESQG